VPHLNVQPITNALKAALDMSPSHPRISLREMAVNFICGCLLLSILIPVGVLAEHWVEDAGHRFVDRMVWRELVESWER
jgi:hypothetical protein